jgi:hypothetical protein
MPTQNLKSAESFLEKLRTLERRLKAEETEEAQTDELSNLPSKVYSAIEAFSNINDIAKIVEVYQKASSIFEIVASKSKNREFTQKAEMLANVWKEKADVERAALGLRQDLVSKIPSAQETYPVTSFDRGALSPRFRKRLLTRPYIKTIRERRTVERRPITDISEEISQELQDVTEQSKGRVLALILNEFFKEQGLSMKMNYPIPIKIGPNIVKYRADIAFFDVSGNVHVVIETMNNLTLEKAEKLSLYLLQIKQKLPDTKSFIVFIKGTESALQFMKSIADGLYSVNEIPILLKQLKLIANK